MSEVTVGCLEREVEKFAGFVALLWRDSQFQARSNTNEVVN